mgnify:CR=1 FL=1
MKKRKIVENENIIYNRKISYLSTSNISLQHSNNNKNINILTNIELMKNNINNNGWTSTIEFYDNNNENIIIKKIYNKNININVLIENFNNEVNSLILMKGEKHIPKIYGIDSKELSIIEEYCGDKLTINNCPKDWKKQFKDIYIILQKYNIYHNDIHNENFCVKNNIIYLIDFGLSKYNIEFQYQNLSIEIIEKSKNINELFNKIFENGKEIRKCMFCNDKIKNI